MLGGRHQAPIRRYDTAEVAVPRHHVELHAQGLDRHSEAAALEDTPPLEAGCGRGSPVDQEARSYPEIKSP